MSEWKECKLLELADKFAMGPFGSNIKADNFVNAGVPVIRGTNLNYHRFVDGEFVFLTEEKANELKTSNCFPGDIVFTHRGTIGQVGLIPNNKYPRYVISQSGMKVTVNSKLLDNIFLFYFFKSEKGQYELLQHESQVGVPSISNPLTSLKSVSVPLPPLPEQRAIASVLSSLDDKIDLLNRQNKTLEAMAEALFRQWFVEPCKDGLPEGWREGNIDSLASVKSGTTPSTSNPDYWGGEIYWTSPRDITNLNGIFLFDTERKITELGLKQIGSGLLPSGSLLMSSRAPVGVLAFTEIPVAINQGYAGIICDKGFSREFLYLWLKTNMDYVQSHANGSTFQEISKSSFKSLLVQIADDKYMINFDSLISPLFLKLKKNSIQIHTLEKLRDTLLPKLMSGEVRVSV